MAETTTPKKKADSIRAFIDSGTWSSAVFTSFTLSLTYFESQILPRLRKQGCQTVTVFVDKDGYRDSLMEQRARGVGREYSVVPIAVSKGGIFHPKLVHLQAQSGDGDLLLVGSGNLTYPGHGGNVEVLEALTAARHSRAFEQAGDFFESLVTAQRVHHIETDALKSTALRLKSVASRGNSTEEVQFIHSLEASGLKQLVQQAKATGNHWRELLVLSPYHHPDGLPIQTLLTDLELARLVVGVCSKKPGKSAFPFADQSFRKYKPRAVSPVAPKCESRLLHAKWFELRSQTSALVLTGSFNATEESFAEANNIECGVLRMLDGPSTTWKDVSDPTFEANRFFRRDAETNHFVFAILASPSSVKGSIVGASAPEGNWSARLESGDEPVSSGIVLVDEQGDFSWEFRGTVDESNSSTLQLTLTRAGEDARGWVQFNEFLRLDASHRNLLSAAKHCSTGTETELDRDTLLIEIFAEYERLYGGSGRNHTQVKPQSGAVTNKRTEPAGMTLEQFRELMEAGTGHSPPYDGSLMLEDLKTGAQGPGLLAHLFRTLIPQTQDAIANVAEGVEESESYDGDGASGGDTQKKRPRGKGTKPANGGKSPGKAPTKQDPLAKASAEIKDRMQSLSLSYEQQTSDAGKAGIERQRASLFVFWWLLEVRFRYREKMDSNALYDFLWMWLRQVSQLRLPPSEKASLNEMVCGAAAVIARYRIDSENQTHSWHDEPMQVNRSLHTFFNASETIPSTVAWAAAHFSSSIGHMLGQGRNTGALEALEKVMSQPAERKVLKAALNGSLADYKDDPKSPLDRPSKNLLRLALPLAPDAPPRYERVNPLSLTCCPSTRCGASLLQKSQSGGSARLESEVYWRLSQFGIAKCLSCSQILVFIED